ncbi:hypothetical protein RB195_019689 [Necator americanus]|uniref:Uncharacterized protein n=1 Tax=Necator americanus TaxID=51031 RepID=A0ABR1CGY6_NECAM
MPLSFADPDQAEIMTDGMSALVKAGLILSINQGLDKVKSGGQEESGKPLRGLRKHSCSRNVGVMFLARIAEREMVWSQCLEGIFRMAG